MPLLFVFVRFGQPKIVQLKNANTPFMGWIFSLEIQVIKNPEGQSGVFVKRCREKGGMHP